MTTSLTLEPEVQTPGPCRCHDSHAHVAPPHSGHCCFWPPSQICHPAAVAAWEAKDRRWFPDGRGGER